MATVSDEHTTEEQSCSACFVGKKNSMQNIFIKKLFLQPPARDGSSFPDISTLKMEAISSSEMSVHRRSTRRHIPEEGILQLKYKFLM
jgi:hypothetical protein